MLDVNTGDGPGGDIGRPRQVGIGPAQRNNEKEPGIFAKQYPLLCCTFQLLFMAGLSSGVRRRQCLAVAIIICQTFRQWKVIQASNGQKYDPVLYSELDRRMRSAWDHGLKLQEFAMRNSVDLSISHGSFIFGTMHTSSS
jgi:hypothetical protein